MKASRAFAGVVIAASLLGIGCLDAPRTYPTALERAGSESALLGGVTSAVTQLLAAPVTRSAPLASDVVWSFSAGPDGAVSHNAAVGLTVVVPRGALSATRTITVTALAGAPVAYGFAPHTEFARKVYLTQDLRGTSAAGALLLKGAHFPGERLELDASGLAIVDEIVAAIVWPGSDVATFGVMHFSGWILASGNGSDEHEEY